MTAVVEDYRLAREAQDARFNNRPGAGAVDVSLGRTEEYDQYFGLGEYAGGGVEPRVTYKDFLRARSRELEAERYAPLPEPEPEPEEEAVSDAPGFPWFSPEACFWMLRPDLEALAADGDGNAAAELARRAAKRAAKRAARLAGAS